VRGELSDDVVRGVQHGLGGFGGGGGALHAVQQVAAGVDEGARDLGATDVDGGDEVHGHGQEA
jgi:hypothetical protein